MPAAVHEAQTRSDRSRPRITRDTHTHHDEEVLIRLATADVRSPRPDEPRIESSGNDFGERPEATDRGTGIPSIPMDDAATGGRQRELTVQLQLELGREPIRGRLRMEDGTEERFVGWLGFVDALKRLCEADLAPGSE